MPCMRVCKILSEGEFLTDFYSRSRTTVDEHRRSAKLAGAHATYEVKTLSCLRVWALGVGGEL